MTEALAHDNILSLTKPSASYVLVDPETARRWLKGNQVNRSIRVAKINQFASDMTNGRWNFSNDAICFAPDGTLLNGQHRLHAIIKSGVAMSILIIRNMPPESMTTMDIGSKRTAADALGWDGEKNRHLLAAAAKLAIVYRDGRIYKDSKVQAVSPGEIRSFIDTHPQLRRSVDRVPSIKTKIDAPPSAIAVAHWAVAERVGAQMADHYLHQLAFRSGEPEGSAVLAVDSRLRQLRSKRAAFSQRAYLALLIKGWNYYATDKRVTSLSATAGARVPAVADWNR